jgi:hypothetical protein
LLAGAQIFERCFELLLITQILYKKNFDIRFSHSSLEQQLITI